MAAHEPWLGRLQKRWQAIGERPVLRRVLSNSGWMLGDRIVRLCLNLLVNILLARHFGPERFGMLNYAVAFAGLFIPLVSLGLDAIIVRNLVREPAAASKTLGTALVIRSVGAFLSFIIIIGCAFWIRGDDQLGRNLLLVLAFSGFFQAFDALEQFFQAQNRPALSVIPRSIAMITMGLARIILLSFDAPLIVFALLNLAELSLIAAGLLISYWRNGGLRPTFDWHLARRLLSESWLFALSSAAIIIYMRIDQVMLGELRGDAAVGVYVAAARISEGWYFVPTALVGAATPTILALHQSDPAAFQRRLGQLFRLVALVGYAAAVGLSLGAGLLIELLYGPAYREASAVLMIHVWAGVFVALGVARGIWITAESHGRFSLAATVSSALLNVLLNFWLIPPYGPLGAAIATLIAYASATIVPTLLWRPARPIAQMILRALLLRA